jgi:hypothetical protein
VGLSRELREMDDLEAEHAQHEWGAALLGVSRHVLAADRIVFAFSLPAASFRTAVRQVRLLPPPARPLQHHLSARRTLRRCGGVATLDIPDWTYLKLVAPSSPHTCSPHTCGLRWYNTRQRSHGKSLMLCGPRAAREPKCFRWERAVEVFCANGWARSHRRVKRRYGEGLE